MSRSRMLQRVHRIVRQQSAAIHAQPRGMTRRQALKVAALTLGGLALPRGGRAVAGARPPRIGIVGAGISGLTAALTLQDNGLSCSIYEASTRVGGRMHSNADGWQQGQVSEWCGEFIDTNHFLLRHFARRFGLTLVDVTAADPADSIDTNYLLGGYYTGERLLRDMQAVTPILHQQVQAIGPVVQYKQYTDAAYYFDRVSVYDWIETYVPGGHGSALGKYLDLAVVSLNGFDSAQQSSLNLILPYYSDERFHTQGGNEQIPQAIAKALPPGTIRLGRRLTAVEAYGDQVTLSVAAGDDIEQVTFDFVILTLPFSVLRNLDLSRANFDPLKRSAIAQLGYGTNSKLVLQFDQRYWNGRGAWPGISNGFIETDLPFQSTWDSSRAEAGTNGLLTNYTGGATGAAYRPESPYTSSTTSTLTAQYAQRFLQELDQVWPGGARHYLGRATLSYPTGDPHLLGSYSAYGIGQITHFGGYQGVPQGRVFFGGEHCSQKFQGYMEGGAEEGRRAALEVLAVSR